VDPVDLQPPLPWWSQVWRYALTVVISAVAWFSLAEWQAENRPWWFWLDAAIGLTTFVLVWWRRRFPILVNIVINVLAPLSASASGPATLAMMSLATRRRWREIVPIALLGLASGTAQILIDPTSDPWLVAVPFIAAIIAVTVGWGLYVGSRRELLATLRERAVRAEAEQSARVTQARQAERARIAREMHDVMAHRISLVTMHAGALAYRDDLDADQVKTTAGLIQQTSHQALQELREVLGLLRDDPGDAAPEPPQPEAVDVPLLVDEAVAAGMSVRFDQEVDLATVPQSAGRTLYRIVQEALTNARKHAAGVTVDLCIAGGPDDGLSITASNPMPFGRPSDPPPTSGLGLVGLSERASLAGGRLHHRRTSDGLFVVEGWLPWPTT